MTLDEQTEKRVYEKLRAFDGLEVAGHAPVNSSIASVLSEGEVLADNGEQYSSIQQAVDVSDGFVFVGPGTYYENVVINKDDFTLQGAGRASLIDGGFPDPALRVSGNSVSVMNLGVQIDPGQRFNSCVVVTGSNSTFRSVHSLDTGGTAFEFQSTANDATIVGCTTQTTAPSGSDGNGFKTSGVRTIVRNCNIDAPTYIGIRMQGDDSIAVNNEIRDTENHGIMVDSCNDCLFGGNRIISCGVEEGKDGIQIGGADNIIFNNRISDSGELDIDNNGTGTVLDGNLTGSAN